MEMTELINHPERLDRDTLYELRSMLAMHPYFQTARILMLHNLFLLHDATFDEELRKAAFYITDRKVIFQMIEAGRYKITTRRKQQKTAEQQDSRTLSLIDDFLEAQQPASPASHPVDASQDYIGYLLWQESQQGTERQEALPMNGGGVVEDFLEKGSGRIVLDDSLETEPDEPSADTSKDVENDTENEILTEIMAGIYIKQGKYENAVKIIRQLSLAYPKKNRYFADQIRFLEKLIINNKHK